MKNKLLLATLDDTTPSQRTDLPQEPNSDFDTIKALASALKANDLDITSTYADWLKTGFALANAFGEDGRELFHELSSLYPAYRREEADKQYDNCLRTQHGEVNLATLFYLAHERGLDTAMPTSPSLAKAVAMPPSPPSTPSPAPMSEPSTLPTFSDKIDTSALPPLLQMVAKKAISSADCDMLLLGAITCLSSCLSNISGIYGGRVVWPNLFLFVSAQAAAGKGRLNLCRQLVQPIHKAKREAFNTEMRAYKQALAAYVVNKKDGQYEEPEMPKMQMLFVPANSSATVVYQVLNENNGIGMLFETEGDTLTTTFGSDHGNYSDGLRNAFHHESISYMRRKDKEYVEMTSPKFSVLLSGTPKQVVSLIPNSENGLFSRFIFYQLPLSVEWLDPFAYADDDDDLDHYFCRLGLDFYATYKMLQLMPEIRFKLTPSQCMRFNTFFDLAQSKCYGLFGSDIVGSVRRMGLITFRIAMVLSALRLTAADTQRTLTCNDTDFDTAMCISQQLLSHTIEMFQQIQAQQTDIMLKRRDTVKVDMKSMLFERLPQQFDRATYQHIGREMGVSDRTLDRYVNDMTKRGIIKKLQYDQYCKTQC